MTENEALQKWCPFVRGPLGVGEAGNRLGPMMRNGAVADVFACIASDWQGQTAYAIGRQAMMMPHVATRTDAHKLWLAKNTVAWVNGRRIYAVRGRYGTAYMIEGTEHGYRTFTEARRAAGGGL